MDQESLSELLVKSINSIGVILEHGSLSILIYINQFDYSNPTLEQCILECVVFLFAQMMRGTLIGGILELTVF